MAPRPQLDALKRNALRNERWHAFARLPERQPLIPAGQGRDVGDDRGDTIAPTYAEFASPDTQRPMPPNP